MILYPAIDIRGGRAVRLLRGDYERETAYDADPLDAAMRFADGGARYLHIVDLDGAREGRPVNLEAAGRIVAALGIPVQLGGGLRSEGAIAEALGIGAERVVLGTAALRDPRFLAAALDAHGDRVVVSVDARAGRVSLEGWTEQGELDAADALASLESRGVGRFIFTPIDVDGTLEGPDVAELERVGSATRAELIYSGGVGELEHLRSLASSALPNLGGVIVGRALYEDRFSVAEAQAALA